LCNYSNGEDTPVHTVASGIAKPRHPERQKSIKKKQVLKKKKSKVMIFGDSHARGCAAELGHLLKKDLEMLGSVTPGSGMRHIKHASTGIIKQLSKDDAVVIWEIECHSKKNASTGIKHLLGLVISLSLTVKVERPV
jgi:hypothetical protein